MNDMPTINEDEVLYSRCVQLAVTEGKVSTSLLQRRFTIGYGRAAKMMDLMEKRGIISPPRGQYRESELLPGGPAQPAGAAAPAAPPACACPGSPEEAQDESEEWLYRRCVELVRAEKKASTSLLQRRFGIGYGRAAKMMDLMAERRVISPYRENQPREVYTDAD